MGHLTNKEDLRLSCHDRLPLSTTTRRLYRFSPVEAPPGSRVHRSSLLRFAKPPTDEPAGGRPGQGRAKCGFLSGRKVARARNAERTGVRLGFCYRAPVILLP